MPFSHGSKAVLKLHDGTALRTLAGFQSAQLDRAKDTAEVTSFADTAKRYIPGLQDATWSAEGKSDPTVQGWVDAAYAQATVRPFEYYPAGEVTGNVKLTGNCIVTGVSEGSSVDDANSLSLEAQVDGAVTRALVP